MATALPNNCASFSLGEVARLTNGELLPGTAPDDTVVGVRLDSRALTTGNLFVALGDNDCVASANSVGSGASIRAEGSTLVADNDFTLYAEGLPAHTPGVFFHGTAQQQTPFGNGTLCVGGFSVRLSPPVFSNSAGASTKPVDLTGTTAAWIVPGATLHFQLWYRDPAGGGFNLSDSSAHEGTVFDEGCLHWDLV